MKPLNIILCCLLVITASLAIANLGAQDHRPTPLTQEQKMMMKNMAMKNMDKYMSSRQAMMSLPPRMQKAQEEAIQFGQDLFNSTRALSANNQACASCHPGGGTTGGEAETPMASEATGHPYKLPIPSLIGAAATFPKYKVPNDAVITLGDMSNNCIMMFMGAQPLAASSREYKALNAYVSSLSNDEKVSVGKMPEMMQQMMR